MRKEAIRRAEIGISQTLTHIFISINDIGGFIERSKIVIERIKNVTNPSEYALYETNFPAIININFDHELPVMRFRSYYMHNKILIIEYIVRYINSNLNQFKKDFENLIRKNELLVQVQANPQNQRKSYLQNYESFINMVEKFLNSMETNHVYSIAEAKVYNLKLMEKNLRTRWNYELIDFKYFSSKKDIKEYSQSLGVLARVNAQIKNETIALVADAKKRSTQ